MSSKETVKSVLDKLLLNPPDDFDMDIQGPSEVPPKKSTRNKRRQGRRLPEAVTPPPAVREEPDYIGPEWSIIEDKALLEAVKNEDTMGHAFEHTNKALRYNWEYISAFVNRATKIYRSPRQCSIRYQTVVRPRETGQRMYVDPLTKETRTVELTPAEVVHRCEGRVSTDLQYAHDGVRLYQASHTGVLQLVEGLAARQAEYKENRRPIDPQWLEPSGSLPAAQESRLCALGVRYDSTACPGDIIKNLEEKRLAQEAAKKKLAEQQASNERPDSPSRPGISVCARQPVVPAGPDLVQSKLPKVIAVPQLAQPHPPQLQTSMEQNISMSHFSTGAIRRAAPYARAGVPFAEMQRIQAGSPNIQPKYVVSSQNSLQPASQMQFVRGNTDGFTVGQASQPCYSNANASQARQTPLSMSSLNRMQEGYLAYPQKVPDNKTAFQPGNAAVNGPQQGVMQFPGSLRLFIYGGLQADELSYFERQQQNGMVLTQRLPLQKQMGQSPMTAGMVPASLGQPHQIRAVPRGFTSQGSRVMNALNDVPASFSSQTFPQWGEELGGATPMTSRTPRVRRHSPSSEAAGLTAKRQYMPQTRPVGSGSENSFPQTAAQVVTAQPSQLQTQVQQQQQQQQQQEQQQLPIEEQHPLAAAMSSITLLE